MSTKLLSAAPAVEEEVEGDSAGAEDTTTLVAAEVEVVTVEEDTVYSISPQTTSMTKDQ